MKRVFTSGSFDLFHIGHLNILEKSAALGDELIVGVSTDELIEEYKGMKPIIPYEQRARIVAPMPSRGWVPRLLNSSWNRRTSRTR